MQKLFLIISSISGILAVSLGAFGAHALKDKLTKEGTLDTYQTAVQYQFYHTLALMAIALLMTKYQSQWLNYAGYSMTFGMLIFSGSLYILCFTGMKWLGAITPIGGLLFIAWLGFPTDNRLKVNRMKTKECPSCAMEVDASSRVCPICQYEFAETKTSYKWIAILLIVVMLLYLFVF